MARQLDTTTLNGAARSWAAQFLLPSIFSESDSKRAIGGRECVMMSFYNATFKDEFGYLLTKFRRQLGPDALEQFDELAKERFKPRADKVLAAMLAEKLAVTPDGQHIAGRIGTVQFGNRVVGQRAKLIRTRGGTIVVPKNVYWPVYAGEGDERAADSGVADALPPGAEPLAVGALNTRISNECAILACNAIVDNLDEGVQPAVIQGRTGAQPADPDTAVTGTLLFTLVCAATAFGAAADAAPGAIATAGAIADDTSADATGTLGYCRASSVASGITPDDDHIDGEAGVSGADFNFNTLAIVSGATVSMTSWTVTMPEG